MAKTCEHTRTIEANVYTSINGWPVIDTKWETQQCTLKARHKGDHWYWDPADAPKTR